MLQAVDQHSQHLSYMDPICDFLYHIKYMYTGDSVKEQVSLYVFKKKIINFKANNLIYLYYRLFIGCLAFYFSIHVFF